MKNLFLLFIALLGSAALTAQNAAPATTPQKSSGGPKMVFENTSVDYGEIKKGSEPVRKVSFTNKGTEPLIIKNARGSCGCTVPTWPKEPIMPGEAGTIEIRYDTQRPGPINKTVKIQTNEGDEEQTLYLKGNVASEDEETVPKSNGTILNPKG
ncbi:MAG: DUF1573 domain-containing protein [Saprospiraceae bacterium]|nr:DUF1573 domain-containing protein [Saprospiraceae bacterium]MBK7811257.1 DUF1573 domain-containing protein [Saprospiraceae bacterium]MBK9631042.1 DUF1573 domain-containing protein [Saprospiraceae bacterium]